MIRVCLHVMVRDQDGHAVAAFSTVGDLDEDRGVKVTIPVDVPLKDATGRSVGASVSVEVSE